MLDETFEVPDAEPAVEDMSILRLDVSGQRREVAEATEWLDPDDRRLLSLWWQETAGRLRRAEIASALGLSVAHTAVRVQRMREQLEAARTVVAALVRMAVPTYPATPGHSWIGMLTFVTSRLATGISGGGGRWPPRGR